MNMNESGNVKKPSSGQNKTSDDSSGMKATRKYPPLNTPEGRLAREDHEKEIWRLKNEDALNYKLIQREKEEYNINIKVKKPVPYWIQRLLVAVLITGAISIFSYYAVKFNTTWFGPIIAAGRYFTTLLRPYIPETIHTFTLFMLVSGVYWTLIIYIYLSIMSLIKKNSLLFVIIYLLILSAAHAYLFITT